jgi:hypothetical protein
MAAPAPGGSPVAPRARGHRNKDTLLRKAVAHVETGLDHVHRLTPQVWPQTRWRHWALEGMTQLPLTMEPDLRWSETFTKVRSLTPRECLGHLRVEVLQAGGWHPGQGDLLSLEDCYVVVTCGGLVARTSTKENCAAPAWTKDEWRAFEFSVADPSAVCYFAVVDEDEFVGVDDEPIGRAALPLRALHNGSIYDASPPGREAKMRDATSTCTVVTELVRCLKPAERKRSVQNPAETTSM